MYSSPYPLRLERPWPQGISPLHGIKEDDGGINTPFMWMRDNSGDRSVQALNFQGMGMNHWMQQRFDSSLLGMQPDVYQAMAAAALQEMRSVDPSKRLLQFQQQHHLQPQQFQCRSSPQLQRHIFQQQQAPQQNILQQQAQNLQEQSPQNHLLQHQLQQNSSQHHLLQQQLQHCFSDQQQPLSEQQQCQQPFQVPNVGGALSQIPSSQSQPAITLPSSLCPKPLFADSNGNLSSAMTIPTISTLQNILGSSSGGENSNYLNLPSTTSVVHQPVGMLTGHGIPRDCQISSTSWVQKLLSNNLVPCHPGGQVEHIPSGGQCVVPQTESLGQSNISSSSMPMSLPQFASRECPPEQEGIHSDSQSHLLFGVNIDSPSLIVPNTVSNMRSIGSSTDAVMQFGVSNYLNAPPCASGSNISLNSDISASACLDESGLLPPTENLGQMNAPTRTFIKASLLLLNLPIASCSFIFGE